MLEYSTYFKWWNIPVTIKHEGRNIVLTKKEIIAQLHKDGVDFCKNSDRNFVYWQEKGILPKAHGRSQKHGSTAAVYEPWVAKRIKTVKKMQESGMTLAMIKENLDWGRLFREHWCELLKLKDEGQTFEAHITIEWRPGFYVMAAMFADRTKYYKIEGVYDGSLSQKKVTVMAKNILTVEECGELWKKLYRKKKRFPEKVDLIKAALSLEDKVEQ